MLTLLSYTVLLPIVIIVIIPGDFGSIVTPLSKIIAKDSNIVVVQLAVKCLGGIAKGLRKGKNKIIVHSQCVWS